jgi:hypothetical protein
VAFTREQIEEFVAQLRQDADLREHVRNAILADDFQALPGALRANTAAIERLTERLETFIAATDLRFEDLETRMTRVQKRLDEIDQRLAQMATTLQSLDGRAGNIEGSAFETKYLWQAPGRWGRRYSNVRVLRLGDEPEMHTALDRGALTEEEWDDVVLADCVLRAHSKEDGKEAVIVVDLSTTVDDSDVERADRRATILRRVWPNVVAAVDGQRILAAAKLRATQLNVLAIVQRESAPPAA